MHKNVLKTEIFEVRTFNRRNGHTMLKSINFLMKLILLSR